MIRKNEEDEEQEEGLVVLVKDEEGKCIRKNEQDEDDEDEDRVWSEQLESLLQTGSNCEYKS